MYNPKLKEPTTPIIHSGFRVCSWVKTSDKYTICNITDSAIACFGPHAPIIRAETYAHSGRAKNHTRYIAVIAGKE